MESDDGKVWDLAELLDTDFNDPALIADAQKRFEVGTVVKQFGTWAVTDYGMECLIEHYPIEKDRLYEDEPEYSWMFHMTHRRGVNMEDFGLCLLAARAYHDPALKTYPPTRRRVTARALLTPKLRFAILKRDGFRCRLCGATADDSRLHVDHILAVVNGGRSIESNLWTLCQPCNAGKGKHPL